MSRSNDPVWVKLGDIWSYGPYLIGTGFGFCNYTAWNAMHPQQRGEFNSLRAAKRWCEVAYAVGA